MAIKHITGTIAGNLGLLGAPTPDDLRVYCLAGKQTVPYQYQGEGGDNHQVQMGATNATYVGDCRRSRACKWHRASMTHYGDEN